jgi:hypothetical protein
MNLTALPVFRDDCIRMPHDGAVRNAQRLALEAILVTRSPRTVKPFLLIGLCKPVQSRSSHGARRHAGADVPATLRHWKNEFR